MIMKKEILILIVFSILLGFFNIKEEINEWKYPEIDDDVITESIPSLNINIEDVKLFAFFSNFFNQIKPNKDLSNSINAEVEENTNIDLSKILDTTISEENSDLTKVKLEEEVITQPLVTKVRKRATGGQIKDGTLQ